MTIMENPHVSTLAQLLHVHNVLVYNKRRYLHQFRHNVLVYYKRYCFHQCSLTDTTFMKSIMYHHNYFNTIQACTQCINYNKA